MSNVVVDLSISADQYVRHYRAPGAVVLARSRDGRKVQFPASILQRFVTHAGISGCFDIQFDAQGRFVSIERRS